MQQFIPWEKIKALQEEIDALKNFQKKTKRKNAKKTKSLWGILKSVKISEKDIQEAKKSVFPYSYK